MSTACSGTLIASAALSRPRFRKDPIKELSILYSHPEWLVRRWIARLGLETTEIILRRNNEPAPLTVRTNTLRTSRQTLLAKLREEGSEAVETQWSGSGIDILSSPGLRSLAHIKKACSWCRIRPPSWSA